MHRLIRSSASLVALSAVALLVLLLPISACGPSDPIQAIRQQQQSGKLEESLESIRALLTERPGDAEVLFFYGSTLTASGQAGLAEWSLREAMKDPDWLVPAGLLLATNSARTLNYEAAIDVATRILDVEPDNTAALVIRSNCYAHSRLYFEEALADVERITELDPDSAEALEPKILSLIGLERIDELTEAIDELGRRVDEGSLGEGVSGWFCATAAIFAFESDDIELADSRWSSCVEAYPSDPEVVVKAVQFYDGQKRVDRATQILRRALEDDPTERSYRVNLAERVRATGAVDEAQRVLREGTESENPRSAGAAWLDLAKHFQAEEDYTAAAEAVSRAVEIVERTADPGPQLLLEYADALLISGQYDRSLEVADQIRYAPYQNMIRARVAQEQRNYELALEYFDKTFLLWPDNPFGRYYAALAAESFGDFDKAASEYRHTIRIAPQATEARTRVARLHMAEGRPGAAIQMLRIKVNEAPLEAEGELLSLELWALTARGAEVSNALNEIRAGARGYVGIGAALARVAKGIRDRAGPALAVKSLRVNGKIDLADSSYVEALRALVEYSYEAGQGDEVAVDLEAAVAVHPDLASVREVVAFRLELMKAPPDEIRRAYGRVLEVEPENARALEGLGRLARQQEPAVALSYYERAAASSPGQVGPRFEAARLLVELGRDDEAEKHLVALLDEHPFDVGAASLLAERHLAREVASARTVDLAKRAVRFGGGAEALDLLARVHAGRDELELSEQAASRAKALREEHPD